MKLELKSYFGLLIFLVALLAATSAFNDTTVVQEPRKMPIFRPLRRVIRHFFHDLSASITIVFQRSEIMPEIRWFRQVEPKTLPNAEIPDMINVAAESGYLMRHISSFDVTAVTLTARPLTQSIQFPAKFVTLFSYPNDTFQYQIDTIIDAATTYKEQKLDGIIWLQAPHPHVLFDNVLTIQCAVKMENESTRFTDELNAFRTYTEQKRTKGSNQVHLMSAGCGKIHRDRENYAEAGGKYTSIGKRQETVPGKHTNVLYEVSFKVSNGSQEDVGVYTCAAERERDRTYISSWAMPLHMPGLPQMLFQACDDPTIKQPSRINSTHHEQLKIIEHRPTCIRCRVFDKKQNTIHLYRNSAIISRSEPHMHLDRHLNVADGGLSELTITFIDPSVGGPENGNYICSVGGKNYVGFNVEVVRAPNQSP